MRMRLTIFLAALAIAGCGGDGTRAAPIRTATAATGGGGGGQSGGGDGRPPGERHGPAARRRRSQRRRRHRLARRRRRLHAAAATWAPSMHAPPGSLTGVTRARRRHRLPRRLDRRGQRRVGDDVGHASTTSTAARPRRTTRSNGLAQGQSRRGPTTIGASGRRRALPVHLERHASRRWPAARRGRSSSATSATSPIASNVDPSTGAVQTRASACR